jgi:hypothetical protein
MEIDPPDPPGRV